MNPTDDRSRTPNPLAPLLDAAEALVSSLDLDEALAGMTSVIGQALQVSKVDVYTYDAERDVLIYEARWVGDDRDDEVTHHGLIGASIDVRDRPSWRPILEGEVVEWHLTDPDLPEEEREIYERARQMTTLDAPLIAGGTVIGVIGLVERERVRRFTPLERDLFSHLARLAAIGIRNAQVVRHHTRCHVHLDALAEAGRVVAAGGDRGTVLQRLAQVAADGLGVAGAAVYEHDADAGAIVCRARYPMSATVTACDELGAGVPLAKRPFEREVLASSQPRAAHIGDVDLDVAERQMLTAIGVAQCIAAPARLAGEAVGLLQICEKSDERKFGAAETAFVDGLATQIALALRRD